MTGTLRVIDAHTHVFPDIAYGEQWQRYLGHEPRRAGTLDELRPLMDEGGIERTIMLLYPRSGERYLELKRLEGHVRPDADIRAEIADDLRELNRWGVAAAADDQRLEAFAGINVRYFSPQEIRAELTTMVERGRAGVKIIPPSMKLYADDPLLRPVFEFCRSAGVPLLSQSGSGGGPPPMRDADHYGRPRYWDHVLGEFPDMTLILAHLGLGYEDDVVELARKHPKLHTDTSLRLSNLGRPGFWDADQLVAGIRSIGVDRVLFGSNFPMTNPATYVQRLHELPFTDSEREALAFGNISGIMGW